MKKQIQFHFFYDASKVRILMITMLLVVLSSCAVYGQSKWSILFRPALNSPTQHIGNAEVVGKLGFEGIVVFQASENVSIFTGRTWNNFYSKPIFDSVKIDFDEIGFSYGITFHNYIGASTIQYAISVAGVLSHTKAFDKNENVIADNRYGFGWQWEGGVMVPLGKHGILYPSVRYRGLIKKMHIEPISHTLHLKYISVGMGLLWRI